MTFNSRKLPDRPAPATVSFDTTQAFNAFMEPMRGTSSVIVYGCAVRHFLHWLKLRRIRLSKVDSATVDRFAGHKCSCRRYRPEPLRDSTHISRVRRFVRFLEDQGYIAVPCEIDDLSDHLLRYRDRLSSLGYSPCTRRIHYSAAEHFAVWLRVSRSQWDAVDDDTIERFVAHDCRCALWRKAGALQETGRGKRRRGAKRFVSFLREEGALVQAAVVADTTDDGSILVYRGWLKQHCGTTEASAERYLQEVSRWLPELGSDPAAYNAKTIRDIVLNQPTGRSRASVRMTATVLRSYLRFLAGCNLCRPQLCQAVPMAVRPKLASLPRYTSPETIERIISACATTSPVAVRDRAIVLLLARLGLRAGDIRKLRLGDIDWANALLIVHGKGRRSATLPLPQDVGDAVLDYIEHGRPVVSDDHLFLRVQAPFTPLASSSEISGIVSRVLARADIKGVPTGAHMFRHSLATAMLRRGASLETVGTVLRHKSPDTTAIYAKVDVDMLLRVAQPWPGASSC